jgi:hypothetical protein
MSDDASVPPVPPDEAWWKWCDEVRVGVDDMSAVTEDQLRPVRERDLGVREADRLFHDARDKLAKLFAYVDRARGPRST